MLAKPRDTSRYLSRSGADLPRDTIARERGAIDLETALKDASTSWGGQVGPFGANYSTTVDQNGNIADQGVRQYNVNVFGWGLKGGKLGNTSVSGSNSFHKSGTKFFKF